MTSATGTMTVDSPSFGQRLLALATRRFSHPWMPMALYLPIGVLLWMASQHYHPRSVGAASLLVLAGVFLWSLVEYLLHRFIFHWVEVKEPIRSIASGLHMAHHRTADTKDLILAPPVVSLIFGSLILGLLTLLTWSFATAALLEAGIFLGYLAYEWVHYGAHRFKPRTPWGKYLKQYHLRHHFKDPRHSYGVTSPLWDYVFRTTTLRK